MEKLSSKLYSWASILDPVTAHQAHETASMPFVYPHLALMPDAHLGKGATVGSVIPTVEAIMPAAVGVDIGCGMRALRLDVTGAELMAAGLAGQYLDLAELRRGIERVIPLSMGHYNQGLYDNQTRLRVEGLEHTPGADSATAIAPKWHLQLGSLGSGNHFIEVSLDEEDRVWLFLHSGSRGVGNKLANRHIKIAQRLTPKRPGGVRPPHADLAYLAEGEPEFDAYLTDLLWAQEFAHQNRAEMMHRVFSVFRSWYKGEVAVTETVSCHHNYTTAAITGGRQVWLSRKGAIDAAEGTMGLIPGSMGTASYVVAGKGNPDSFWSAPHGAGRQHSRTQAKALFTMESLEEQMQGVEWRHTEAFLDEHPEAYKDINTVMADAADLVEIRHTLHQIVNVKGD